MTLPEAIGPFLEMSALSRNMKNYIFTFWWWQIIHSLGIRKMDVVILQSCKVCVSDLNVDNGTVILTDRSFPQHEVLRLKLNCSISLNFTIITIARLKKYFLILFTDDVYRKVLQYKFCNFFTQVSLIRRFYIYPTSSLN